VAVRRCLGIRPSKWHNAKSDAYLALRLWSFFCFFLDRNVQLEPIWATKLWYVKAVRLKRKKEPMLSEWEDEELPF
jgi:hypothetical protein